MKNKKLIIIITILTMPIFGCREGVANREMHFQVQKESESNGVILYAGNVNNEIQNDEVGYMAIRSMYAWCKGVIKAERSGAVDYKVKKSKDEYFFIFSVLGNGRVVCSSQSKSQEFSIYIHPKTRDFFDRDEPEPAYSFKL